MLFFVRGLCGLLREAAHNVVWVQLICELLVSPPPALEEVIVLPLVRESQS